MKYPRVRGENAPTGSGRWKEIVSQKEKSCLSVGVEDSVLGEERLSKLDRSVE